MKTTDKILLLLMFTLASVQVPKAQVHNFDSLYKNHESFRQEFETSTDFKDLFLSDEIMNITIASDFKNLVRRKGKDEYQPALFQYHMNDTIVLTRNITIRPRGMSRKSVCFFPPIKLNFSKSKETILEQIKEFDKMKMVPDCKRGEAYEQYLLSEYLAYKLLNILTDYSYRVRLVRVSYVDTGGKYNNDTRYAFIMENEDQMAERLNAIVIDVKGIRDELVEKKTLVNAYLFQYLIGNTDWSVPGDHNMRLIKSKDPVLTSPFVIPFDFDLAGIVDASYAFPDSELGIKSVRERHYMGICLPESDIREGLKVFLEKKDQIYALYQNTELINGDTMKKTISYIDEFYGIVEDETRLSRNIIESCK
jgi:hypothetical protein